MHKVYVEHTYADCSVKLYQQLNVNDGLRSVQIITARYQSIVINDYCSKRRHFATTTIAPAYRLSNAKTSKEVSSSQADDGMEELATPLAG